MLSLTYEITTALSHTDELISPPYDIAIVTISYGRVTKSPVWDSMMSKKNMGWPFYAAVLRYSFSKHRQIDYVFNSLMRPVTKDISKLWPFVRDVHNINDEFLSQKANNVEIISILLQWPRNNCITEMHNAKTSVCQTTLKQIQAEGFVRRKIQWNPSIKATQDGGLSKEVACHEG